MNERFKFRAWDEQTKIYFYNAMIETLAPISVWLKNGWVVEQCTGLKDKNGELIYEGDVLLLDPDDPFALVVWDEDVAMFCLQQEDVCYTFDNCGYTPREIEIVGNIHENPELLEDK